MPGLANNALRLDTFVAAVVGLVALMGAISVSSRGDDSRTQTTDLHC